MTYSETDQCYQTERGGYIHKYVDLAHCLDNDAGRIGLERLVKLLEEGTTGTGQSQLQLIVSCIRQELG